MKTTRFYAALATFPLVIEKTRNLRGYSSAQLISVEGFRWRFPTCMQIYHEPPTPVKTKESETPHPQRCLKIAPRDRADKQRGMKMRGYQHSPPAPSGAVSRRLRCRPTTPLARKHRQQIAHKHRKGASPPALGQNGSVELFQKAGARPGNLSPWNLWGEAKAGSLSPHKFLRNSTDFYTYSLQNVLIIHV